VVIHKDIAPLGGAFSALDRTMTWTVIVTQLVLLLALAAIAYSAHRAIAEAERHRAELERLGSLGNLAAGIAHEVRNPLNTIALTCRYIERLLEQSSQEAPLRAEVNRNFEIVASELGRLTRTLDDFLLLAKPISPPATECDLDALVDDALAPFTHEFEAANVRLVRERGRPVRILADPDRARQVFANIIRNGVQAMRDGGTLTVATEVAHGQARVAFADTGSGISPKHLHRIFEPYFSTKRSGLGLGLALSLRIVQAHGGTIDAANRPGGGAVLTVSLPTHPRETADNA
jgi:signal transduction histidine kinase